MIIRLTFHYLFFHLHLVFYVLQLMAIHFRLAIGVTHGYSFPFAFQFSSLCK